MLRSPLPTPKRIRLLVADDHPQTREQLTTSLTRDPHFDIIAVASNSAQTLQLAHHHTPDLLLIDPIMRDGLGLATLRQVCIQLPVATVVLTAVVDTSLNIQLRAMGVKQILVKGIPFADLLKELLTAIPKFS